MASRDKERLAVIEDLVSPLAECAPLLQHLDEAGAKPCAVLLQTALEYRRVGEWEDCRKVALSAREYAWEQLHSQSPLPPISTCRLLLPHSFSGPSWQAVAQVHRDAYGVAGTLVAIAIFLSGATGSLDQAVYSLDLVALMAGGRFQNTANLFIERMERHAELESNAESTTATAQSDRYPTRTTHGKTVFTVDAEKATSSAPRGELHPVEPPFKKAKSGASFGAGQESGRGGGVRRVRLPPLDVFQREYMETATPVILTGVMDGWPAMGEGRESRSWSDTSYLRRVAGRRTVPVEVGGCYTGDGWRQELMTVAKFIGRYIEPKTREAASAGGSSDGGMLVETQSGEQGRADEQGSARAHTATGRGGQEKERAYLAQHQLLDQIPPLRRDIITPDYCALLLADEEDDTDADRVATNAWFGPAGTVSPLHNDPFHNLLAQVVGSKRVLMVDRALSASVYPRPGLMTNTSEVDAANPDLSKHPRFTEAMPLLECELRKGEMLYIPPLFWHHVESLDVSFSVSFWWGKRRTLSKDSCEAQRD